MFDFFRFVFVLFLICFFFLICFLGGLVVIFLRGRQEPYFAQRCVHIYVINTPRNPTHGSINILTKDRQQPKKKTTKTFEHVRQAAQAQQHVPFKVGKYFTELEATIGSLSP